MKVRFLIIALLFGISVGISAQDGYILKQESLTIGTVENGKKPKTVPIPKEMLFYKE